MLKYSLAELIDQLPNKRYVTASQAEDTWVEVPSCVASLAATRIAELASLDFPEDAEATSTLLQKQGLELMLENMNSPLNDVRESAAVALDYLLTSRNPLRCRVLSSSSALDLMLKRLSDHKEGMRFTVACILHSFYCQAREEGETASNLIVSFRQGELLRALLRIASEFQRLSLLNQHLQHLLDLMQDRLSHTVNRSRAKAMVEAGLLKMLEDVEHQEVMKSELNFSQYIVETIRQVRAALA
jgi:hypothetical protein